MTRGEGFLHEASCVCCGVRDLTEAKGIANGYGVITDQDNDKVFFHQKRREAPALMPGMEGPGCAGLNAQSIT